MAGEKMLKVLVAEDDESTRFAISKIVEHLGCVAYQCSDGDRAIKTLDDNPDISVVITDVIMPGMSGTEMVKKIRSKSQFTRLPILIISGAVGPKEISDVLSSGATAFLAKPVKTSEIREYLNRYLSEEQLLELA